MKESDKMRLTETHNLVESIHWPEVIYAVDKNSKHMVIFYGNKQELPLWADQVKAFATELLEVWEHIK